MKRLKLTTTDYELSIHRLPATTAIPRQVDASGFLACVRTDDELSLVCASSIDLEAEKTDTGWACLKVEGPLDLALTGVLSRIASILAQSNISVFAISTFDTDYILVKAAQLQAAKQALAAQQSIEVA